jgi:hypothetical protein
MIVDLQGLAIHDRLGNLLDQGFAGQISLGTQPLRGEDGFQLLEELEHRSRWAGSDPREEGVEGLLEGSSLKGLQTAYGKVEGDKLGIGKREGKLGLVAFC